MTTEQTLHDTRTSPPAAAKRLLEDVVPLTPLQQGIYFHSALAEGDSEDVYVVQMVLRLEFADDRPLDGDVLRRSAQGLLDRHANLRTCFRRRKSGEPIGVVLRTVDLPWERFDLRALPVDARERESTRIIEEDSRRHFDPARAPLLRFTLIDEDPRHSTLVFTSHHLLLDGWSTPLFVRELFEVYAAGGDPAVLPRVQPFKRYLDWLSSRDKEEGLSTWASYLNGLDVPTRVAQDGASRTPETPVSQSVIVPDAVSVAFAELMQRTGITANAVVLTAWALLLRSLTGGTDVTFGAVVSGRSPEVPGIESMIGLFINTVPVRVRLDPSETGAQLLERVRREQLSVMDHQYVGLSEINRSTGMGELFDTLVVFESYPVDSTSLARAQRSGGVTVKAVEGRDATNYPLVLVAHMGATLELTLEFQSSLFGTADIDAIGERLASALDQLTTAATTRIGAAAEQDIALPPVHQDWRPAPTPPRTMIEEAAACVASSTAHAAVVSAAESITFGELDHRSNQLARALVDRGVGPETAVAVATTRSVDAVVALWAVIRAGGVYVPLDPSYPSSRLAGMLADVHPALVLASTATLAVATGAAASRCPVLVLDDPAQRAALASYSGAQVSEEELLGPVLPDSALYVIFTSGSTGKPKGVTVTHRGLTALLASHRRALHEPVAASTGRDHIGVAHAWSMGFDASWQPLLWMFSGHAVHLVDEDAMRDPELLVELIADHRLDFVELTPSVLERTLAAGLLTNSRHRPAAVGFGGEAVTDTLWSALRSTNVRAVNLYGPTESTVDALIAHVSASPSPTVGSPVDGSAARVLDTWLRPVPHRTGGELYTSGAGLARGYLGAAAATATRFVADPFGAAGSRMYRTGDVVSVERDHWLRFFGRADDQVKIRGHRVEPGEVESALQAVDGVEQAVVTVHVDDRGTARLVGYIVAPTSAQADALSGIRDALTASLPDYMVPAALVVVGGFAYTANGKIDRSALPAPDFQSMVSATAPRNDVEAVIATAVGDALGLERVGIDDDFFSLGGDSIVSIALVSLVRAAGLHVTARDIFEGRTVAGVALRVQSRAAGRSTLATEVAGADVAAGVGPIPLTPVVVSTLARGGAFRRFSQARLLITPASVTESDLAAAAHVLLDTHALLRSVLVGEDTDRQWTVREQGSVTGSEVVRRVDVRGQSHEEFMSTLAHEREATFRAMNPAFGDIIAFVWFDRGPDETGRLLVVVHHLAVDAVSWQILVADLQSAWSALASGRQPNLLGAGTSFRAWAVGLRAAAGSARLRSQAPFWQSIDAAAATEPRLAERDLDPSRDFVGDVVHAISPVSEATTARLLRTATDASVGVDHVLAAALAKTVARVTGVDRPVRMDIETHGRVEDLVDGVDLSRTMGWFTAISPVLVDVHCASRPDVHCASRPDVHGASRPDRMITAVAEQMRRVPDGGVGYGVLTCFGESTRATTRTPEILFNYLGRATVGEKHGQPWSGAPEVGALGGTIDPATPADHVLQFDAIIEDTGSGPRLLCEWAGTRGPLDEHRTRVIADTFADVLVELTTPDPDSKGLS